MRLSWEEEEQDVTAKLDPDLEGGRGPNQHHQVTRSNHGHRSLLSPRGGKGGMGQRKEGRRMKGRGGKKGILIATNVGEIAQIECFAHRDT